MPTIKNRTVLEVARNLTGFLNLDLGLTRGPAPNHHQVLKDLQGAVEEQKRQLSEKEGQLTRSEKRLSQTLRRVRESESRLSEKEGQLRQAQEQLSQKDRQLRQAEKLVAARSEQAQEARRRLLDRDRQVAALQAGSSGSGPRDEELYSGVSEVLDGIPIDLGGGCSLDKAYLMAWLIRRHDLKRTLDIGVYRGRSLFPQALAHARFTGGVAYGVDPFSASEAKEEDIEPADNKNKETINRFVEDTDWDALCRSVTARRDELGLGDHCVLLRETSARAAAYFEENAISFGMIHIDGNHDTEKVMEDLELYLPRVEKEGFVLLDDVSFASVRPAYEKLEASATLVYERSDHDGANDFAVFRNGPPAPNAGRNRRVWVRDFW